MVCASYQNIGGKRQKARKANKESKITVDGKEKQGKDLSHFVLRMKYMPQKSYSEDWLTIRKHSKTKKVVWVSTHILYITQDAHHVSWLNWLSNSGIIKIII